MIIKEFTHANRTVRIENDPSPESPREQEPLGVIVHWHRRYSVGDQIINHCNEAELRADLEIGGDKVTMVLPVYLLDHSGITISTKPFGDRFDSGQVGWMYAMESEVIERWMGSPPPEDTIREVLESEIKEFDAFLRGEIYSCVVLNVNGEVLDSCGGFYSVEDCEEEGKILAANSIDPVEERIRKVMSEPAVFALPNGNLTFDTSNGAITITRKSSHEEEIIHADLTPDMAQELSEVLAIWVAERRKK